MMTWVDQSPRARPAGTVYSPVSGTVTEVNTALADTPELINSDPYGRGWLIKLKLSDASGAEALMDSAGYEAYNATR